MKTETESCRAAVTAPCTGREPGTRDRAFDLGGTIRAASIGTTLARARGLMAAIGITRVGNVTGLDHVGVPTWQVVRPLAQSLTVSQGKGLTHELAQASGLMESIEVHHAEHFVPRGQLKTLSDAVADRTCASPLLLPIRPSARLRQDSRSEWVEGRDLVSGKMRRVPRDCIHLGHRSRRQPARLFVASSNGLASGNTRSEALLHALCEVIERDQASLWIARRQLGAEDPRGRLRLDRVSDPYNRWLIERCDAAGVYAAAWYVSQTVPIPCFFCRVFDSSGRTFYPQRAAGFGGHPYRRVALSRAITEALQSRLTHIAGGRDDVLWSRYKHAIRIDDDAGASWARQLEEEPQTLDPDDMPEAPSLKTIDELLAWVLSELSAEGLPQAIAVDLTQQALQVPVFHVTVPGLEGLLGSPGYTPGPRMQRLLAQCAG